MFLDSYFAVYQLPIQHRAASLMMIPILDLALLRTVPRHAARAAHEVSRFGKIGSRTAMITDAPPDAEPMRPYAIPTIHSLYCTVRALGNGPQINHQVQVFIKVTRIVWHHRHRVSPLIVTRGAFFLQSLSFINQDSSRRFLFNEPEVGIRNL
ncbi:unnamed protein product [Pelagomonas calceolata]|uniref:Uncharacterized protein n=1 Tax=Pelagomonas calceolata TaxID=35677 RepID=A0A8J2SR12_9STRA|nr:unnamed protein product [Pelagomonas calceolata]